MAQVFTGQHGRFLVRAKDENNFRPVGMVRNWTYTYAAETIDTTVLGNTHREKVAGLKSMTGSATLIYYREDSGAESPTGWLLDRLKNQEADDAIEVRFDLQGYANTPQTTQIDALITNYTVACAVGETVNINVAFESTGAPVQADL